MFKKNQEKMQAARAAATGNPSTSSDSSRENGEAPQTTPAAPPDVSHPSQTLAPDTTNQPRQPAEHVDEILNVLKTSFPLLILSLETMVDQISHKFKLTADEDIYRNICLLLQDAVQVKQWRLFLPQATSHLFRIMLYE